VALRGEKTVIKVSDYVSDILKHVAQFISVINQLDAQNVCFTVSFISCLYMFRAHVLIIRRSKWYYTASGIITTSGGRLVHENKKSVHQVG